MLSPMVGEGFVMLPLGKKWALVRIVPDLWFILSVANNSFPGVSLQLIVQLSLMIMPNISW